MLFEIFRRLSDPYDPDSLANRFRRRRFAFFRSLLPSVPKPLKILDVGGTEEYWENMGFDKEEGVKILILNLRYIDVHHSNFQSVVGDARDMRKFSNGEFDVVFSNAAIQALGNYENQHQMAREIRRVGKRYFVQAPNRYFPIEPHSLTPFFQFFPLAIQAWIITRFGVGWYEGISNTKEASEKAASIRLLSKKEIAALFPDGIIKEEKVCFLTKSFIVYGGWDLD